VLRGGGISAAYPAPQAVPDTLDIANQAMFNANQEMFLTMYSDMRTASQYAPGPGEGKQTEVRMINGYVCQTGDKYGIDTPSTTR
jgi:2-dehydropantoate 2-reductase